MSMHSRVQRLLTNLALLLPISFVAQTAYATGACPGNLALYGEWAGGFCCNGTVGPGGGSCNGSICALDPTRTQGLPLCYQENSTTCRNMGSQNFYGGLVGGFCCNGSLGADKDTCTGTICALDPSRAQGHSVCEPMEAQCPAGQQRYGEWAGGFCCNGTVGAGAGSCNGTVCALDPNRTQGLVLCPTVMPECSPWETRYGESVGGFCCDGTVSAGSCSGTICALDSLRTQGNPLCTVAAPRAHGTQGNMEFFSSNPAGGSPFRLFADDVETIANGVEISGNVTISGGAGLPEIMLAEAEITLTFDANGYISTCIGTAHASLPSAGGLTMNNLGEVTLGLDWGANLNDPENAYHVDAPMKDDRQYLVFHVSTGLSGSYGPVSFSAPIGAVDTLLVVDPRDPSVYFHGDLSSVPGLSALDEVGIGFSVQGLLPFEHQNTWGIEHFADDFDGHIVIEAPIPFATLPLSAEGEMTVRLPTSSDPTTRMGMNGTLDLDIEFVPGVASFGFPLANATVGGHFTASSPVSGEAYFSAYAGTQGFIDALPDLSVMPTIGVNVAGRLSTNAANDYLRVAGHGSFQGREVSNLDMQYSPSGVWVSGNFQLGGGFGAKLSGQVMATYASLSGEVYVNIPIIGAKQIVSGTYQAINYVNNGAVCGWTTAANAAQCGWANFADQFCRTFPWLCTAQPATCTFANSCTQNVWVQQTIQEPNFNYGAFTAKGNVHVSTPNNITIDFTNKLCPAEVGSCSVGAENLNTATPKVCVTSSIFGKFCQALQLQ